MIEERLYTTEEIASFLGIDTESVEKIMQYANIEPYREISGTKLYQESQREELERPLFLFGEATRDLKNTIQEVEEEIERSEGPIAKDSDDKEEVEREQVDNTEIEEQVKQEELEEESEEEITPYIPQKSKKEIDKERQQARRVQQRQRQQEIRRERNKEEEQKRIEYNKQEEEKRMEYDKRQEEMKHEEDIKQRLDEARQGFQISQPEEKSGLQESREDAREHNPYVNATTTMIGSGLAIEEGEVLTAERVGFALYPESGGNIEEIRPAKHMGENTYLTNQDEILNAFRKYSEQMQETPLNTREQNENDLDSQSDDYYNRAFANRNDEEDLRGRSETEKDVKGGVEAGTYISAVAHNRDVQRAMQAAKDYLMNVTDANQDEAAQGYNQFKPAINAGTAGVELAQAAALRTAAQDLDIQGLQTILNRRNVTEKATKIGIKTKEEVQNSLIQMDGYFEQLGIKSISKMTTNQIDELIKSGNLSQEAEKMADAVKKMQGLLRAEQLSSMAGKNFKRVGRVMSGRIAGDNEVYQGYNTIVSPVLGTVKAYKRAKSFVKRIKSIHKQINENNASSGESMFRKKRTPYDPTEGTNAPTDFKEGIEAVKEKMTEATKEATVSSTRTVTAEAAEKTIEGSVITSSATGGAAGSAAATGVAGGELGVEIGAGAAAAGTSAGAGTAATGTAVAGGAAAGGAAAAGAAGGAAAATAPVSGVVIAIILSLLLIFSCCCCCCGTMSSSDGAFYTSDSQIESVIDTVTGFFGNLWSWLTTGDIPLDDVMAGSLEDVEGSVGYSFLENEATEFFKVFQQSIVKSSVDFIKDNKESDTLVLSEREEIEEDEDSENGEETEEGNEEPKQEPLPEYIFDDVEIDNSIKHILSNQDPITASQSIGDDNGSSYVYNNVKEIISVASVRFTDDINPKEFKEWAFDLLCKSHYAEYNGTADFWGMESRTLNFTDEMGEEEEIRSGNKHILMTYVDYTDSELDELGHDITVGTEYEDFDSTESQEAANELAIKYMKDHGCDNYELEELATTENTIGYTPPEYDDEGNETGGREPIKETVYHAKVTCQGHKHVVVYPVTVILDDSDTLFALAEEVDEDNGTLNSARHGKEEGKEGVTWTFEGWDETAKEMVQMRVSESWRELYMIGTDELPDPMSGIPGVSSLFPVQNPLSNSQIEQYITTAESYSGFSDERAAIMRKALSYVGKVAYYYGAPDPDYGVSDCSAFISKALGISRVSTATFTTYPSTSNPVPGDLLVRYGVDGKSNHVMMFLGYNASGQMVVVHCSSNSDVQGVGVVAISDSYASDFKFVSINNVMEHNSYE